MKLAPQSKPYTPRQILRILNLALVHGGWLTASQATDALALNHMPVMEVHVADPTGANGMRTFRITVSEV